jgi:hypothetical protein
VLRFVVVVLSCGCFFLLLSCLPFFLCVVVAYLALPFFPCDTSSLPSRALPRLVLLRSRFVIVRVRVLVYDCVLDLVLALVSVLVLLLLFFCLVTLTGATIRPAFLSYIVGSSGSLSVFVGRRGLGLGLVSFVPPNFLVRGHRSRTMTELKRAMTSLQEIQALLAVYTSSKEAGRPVEHVARDVCVRMQELGEKVVGIEARYHKSVQGNNSIYGPKTTETIKAFLEEYRLLQVRNSGSPCRKAGERRVGKGRGKRTKERERKRYFLLEAAQAYNA